MWGLQLDPLSNLLLTPCIISCPCPGTTRWMRSPWPAALEWKGVSSWPLAGSESGWKTQLTTSMFTHLSLFLFHTLLIPLRPVLLIFTLGIDVSNFPERVKCCSCFILIQAFSLLCTSPYQPAPTWPPWFLPIAFNSLLSVSIVPALVPTWSPQSTAVLLQQGERRSGTLLGPCTRTPPSLQKLINSCMLCPAPSSRGCWTGR